MTVVLALWAWLLSPLKVHKAMVDDSNYSQLIKISEKILTQNLSEDQLVESLDQYLQYFTAYMQTIDALSVDQRRIKATELEQLNHEHKKVIDKTLKTKAGVSSEFKTLREKEKGLIQYIDNMPKNISLYLNRKT